MRFGALFLILLSWSAKAQFFNGKVNTIANSAHQLTAHLLEFDALGVKEPGTPELNATRNWLFNYYSSLGYAPILDSFLLNNNQLYNVIAEKKGITDKYIIVCGHYDTRTGVGANDNGSGVAVIMEMARLLKEVETKYTLRFINFSGEENGLLGSIHYANNVVGATDTNLLFVFNIDQLGGTKGQNDNFKINCESDQDGNPSNNNTKSLEITQFMANVFSLYTSITPVLAKAYASDYIPFENLGYVITGLYQYSNDPFNHSANDFASNMDTLSFKEIGKGSIACLLHFAEATFISNAASLEYFSVTISPNPNSGKFNIAIPASFKPQQYVYSIIGLNGMVLQKGEVNLNENLIETDLVPGIYFIKIESNQNQSYFQRIQVIPD